MMDPIRRKMLATGAAATAMAAAPQVFAQQAGQTGTAKFYERGSVRIRYDEAGSGFPLLIIAGGGLAHANAVARSARIVVTAEPVEAEIVCEPA